MRVVQVVNAFTGGGAERAVMALHPQFLELGLDSHVLAVREAAGAHGPGLWGLGKRAGNRILDLPLVLGHFTEYMRVLRPDVIHAHCEVPELVTAMRSPHSARLFVTEHTPLAWPRRAAIGHWVRRHLRARNTSWLRPQDAVQVRFIDVAARTIPNPAPAVAARWQARPRTGGPVVATAGRLVESKQVEMLVRAAEMLPDMKLHVIGDGPRRDHLERASANLRDRVTFHGMLPDPWPVAVVADWYVTASIVESDGLAVVEALCAGMPVLARDIAAHRGLGVAPEHRFSSVDQLCHMLTTYDAASIAELQTNVRTSLAEARNPARIASTLAACYR